MGFRRIEQMVLVKKLGKNELRNCIAGWLAGWLENEWSHVNGGGGGK